MEEHIFFENKKISISKNQFIVEDQVFDMDSIKSIKIGTIPANRKLSGNTAIIGALFLSLNEVFFAIGLVLLAVAGYLWKTTKPEYSIILITSSGEKQALASENKEHIEQIFSALHEMLVNKS